MNTVKIFSQCFPSGGWFTQHTLEVRGNDHKLCQKRFTLDARKKFSWTEWSGIGISYPERQKSHHPWMCSRGVWVWHLGIKFRGGYSGAGVIVGLDDLEGNLTDLIIL